MSVILQRTISAVVDKRIVLSNSQFARPLPMGSTWTQIRIGFRFHMRDSGANLTSTPKFTIGVSSGSTNLFGDATTDNFVGIQTNNATWTRTSTTHYILSANGIFPVKRVGSTLTLGGVAFNVQSQITLGAAAATADRQVYFVDITKGSPNYTLRPFYCNNTLVDQSLNTFLTQMEIASPSLTGYSFPTAQTIAASEAAGVFNHVNIAWDRTTPEIEICDLAIARFS
jgi:hypothetical protein